MDYDDLKIYCAEKQGAREDYPFGPEPLVIKVSSKMFALISDGEKYPSISLKCDPFLAEILREKYAAITAGYHLNKKHWNTVLIDGSIPEDEIMEMIDQSYQLVFKSLKKTEREMIMNA
ncbi:MmcQ/YjbR family DNA-binding protein [Chengkuizengella axinellae]|uniref:MmcQ/YjbR family DNA-binding protein n=1 Tax=Chengkuizengella axinellae TaxID=3064388 RepID=A0ABT9IUN3_9BACL|nr:MmcQ/YjbR family DNA-binding protein [Chengkuizengella sp. 2205SS18-9]MDP5273069.1 MmcQ/YjbR family DNA-binding protein [Chengkuizengella sp. 2205SS18-9]